MSDTARETEPGAPDGWGDIILRHLDCVWNVLEDLGRVLKYTRLPLIVTLLAGAALIYADQGQDLLVIHLEEPRHFPAFYAAVIFWALNAWYWARISLRHGAAIPIKEKGCKGPFFGGRLNSFFGGRKKRVVWLVGHVPRVIGTAAFLMIAVAQLKVALRHDLGSIGALWLYGAPAVSVLLAILFYAFTLLRRRWLQEREKAAGEGGSGDIGLTPTYRFAGTMKALPAHVRIGFVLFSAILAITFVVAIYRPTWVTFAGPDVVFLVGASLWIAPGTWLLFVSKRGDFPVFGLLIAFALIFSFVNDNHGLRRAEGEGLATPRDRVTPDDALRAWRESSGESATMIMVATAGGGSRAAYWTATVLGAIRDLHADFDKQLFGISGVSGGSLGATVYRGLVTALPAGDAACTATTIGRTWPYRHCGQAILKEDFLGPTVASMVYPDLVQRFLPWGFLPDRAEALEKAWEATWREHLAKNPAQNLMREDFFGAWTKYAAAGGPAAADSQLPALFLNGTSVATGRRIVTSNLDVSASLTDAIDLFEQWPINIPLSTAANNSARFPIVGPAGTLSVSEEDTEDYEEYDRFDRIVDGGYFENFGAATALDLLQAIDRNSCQPPGDCDHGLVVIQISSDPGYPGVETSEPTPGEGNRGAFDASPGSFAAEIRSPVKTLLNTRTARGVLAAQNLHDYVADRSKARPNQPSRFVEFRLDIPSNRTAPPLGWVLSDAAARTMNCQLIHGANLESLEALAALLEIDRERLRILLDDLQSECNQPL